MYLAEIHYTNQLVNSPHPIRGESCKTRYNLAIELLCGGKRVFEWILAVCKPTRFLSHAGGFKGLYLNLKGQINTAAPSVWAQEVNYIHIPREFPFPLRQTFFLDYATVAM